MYSLQGRTTWAQYEKILHDEALFFGTGAAGCWYVHVFISIGIYVFLGGGGGDQ